MNVNLKFFVGLIMVLMIGISSCYYDVEEELYPEVTYTNCDTLDVTYSLTVLPILQTNCYGCHSAITGFGNVTIEPYSQLMLHVNSGKLLCSINHQNGCSPMPQGLPQMLSCDIAKIEKWIENGAAND